MHAAATPDTRAARAAAADQEAVADAGEVAIGRTGLSVAGAAGAGDEAALRRPGAPSAAVTPPAGAPGAAEPIHILDVGSGGGLPGVVLAICRPDWRVTCVDTVAKKATFIRQAAAELRLPNLAAAHARVEQLADTTGQRFQVITARAFSSLPDLVALTRGLLAPGGCWMAMKGAVPADEIAQLPADVDVFHVEQVAVPGLEARRCLVWMRLKPPGA